MRTQRLVGWLSQPAVWLAGWLEKCLLGRKKNACGSTHRGRKLGFPNSAFWAGKKPRGRKRERKEERNTDRTATATAICTWPQGREAVAGKGGEQDRKCGQPWKARARHSQPPPASHSQQEERRPQPATASHRGGRGHRGTQASFLNSPGIIPKLTGSLPKLSGSLPKLTGILPKLTRGLPKLTKGSSKRSLWRPKDAPRRPKEQRIKEDGLIRCSWAIFWHHFNTKRAANL
jgi:hypothetical protein